MGHWAQARLRSHWIDILAIPILASIMEAQPIFVVLLFTSGEPAVPFLSELSIILLALGLRWWAMGVRAYTERGISKQNEQLLRVLGLLLAGGLVIGTPVLLVRSVLSLILSSALVLLLWWHSMQQKTYEENGQLLIFFRIGFAILLFLLIIAVFYSDSSVTITLLTALAQAIPIFFLSGLLAISFTRIALIRHETARYAPENATGLTRNWLFALTICWLAVVLAVLALEAFSFQAVVVLVSDIWYVVLIVLEYLVVILAYILTPILYVFSFLFALLFHFFPFGGHLTTPPLPPAHIKPIEQQQTFSPEALAAGRFILLLLSLLVLFFIVRAILRRLPKARKDDEVEEIREGLSLRLITQQRRKQRLEQALPQTPQLETLEAESARAYYRELLQTIASGNPAFARRSDETPAEYQARLLIVARQTFVETMQEADIPSEQEILDVLTHDYNLERYSGKHMDSAQKNYLRAWVPRLIARVTHTRTP